ncbi:MAG: mechanosensitive ion channel [Gammaproteobacteria bacterium]|nr:mechanosensitive ion channel [Gammaproteobacteria bacterium]
MRNASSVFIRMFVPAAIWLLAASAPPLAVAQPPLIQPAEDQAAEADSADAEVEELIRLLEDDEARNRLIERLRAAEAEAAEPAVEDVTLAERLAAYTRSVAEGAAGLLNSITNLTDEVVDIMTGATEIDTDALQRVVLGVALVVAATFAVYVLLRLAFHWLQRGIAGRAEDADLVRRIKMKGVSSLIDVATVLLAWGTGYGVALYVGQTGRIGVDQSLFLNAFLIVELVKAVTRVVLAPRWPALRFVPVDDTNSAYWYFWLSREISLVGYGFMFVAPLLAAGVSATFAEAVRIIVLFAALVILIAVILQNRDRVRALLMRRAANSRTETVSRTLATVGRLWHIVAILYAIVVYALWLADPDNALRFVLMATAKTAAAVVIGLLVNTFIARLASGGMRLPADVKQRLPLLEARLNAFVPGVLRAVRIVVMIAVAITILQAWNVVDFAGWVASETGQNITASLISAVLILLIGGAIYLVVQSWIEYRLSPGYGIAASARERTLLALFRNAFTIVLVVVVAMLVLSELGVNIGPLLAGAGVVGLAVGFGAQKLVQDVINGAFIQFENTMNEGDVVTAGSITGVVERLTIRSVSLRSLDGTYHVIPFSSVDTVSNFMKHFSYHLAAIGVAYREDILEVKAAMEEAFELLKQTDFAADILDAFEMQGIVEFADSAVVVRGRIKTLPGKQWAVGRAYNEFVKQVFDERGIEIPFPHVTLYLGEDKQGKAPPLRVLSEDAQPEKGSGRFSEEKESAREPSDDKAEDQESEAPAGTGTRSASSGKDR